MKGARTRPGALLVLGLGAALATAGPGLLAAGCSGDRRGRAPSAVGPANSPAAVGLVLDYTDSPARGAPLTVRDAGSATGGAPGLVNLDGVFAIGPLTAGAKVLRCGDSVSTPTLLVPFSMGQDTTGLERPIYLPALESGIGAVLPASISSNTTITGEALPGVSLALTTGTTVLLPAGTAGEVRVLGVSPSRLPLPLPGGLAPQAAYLVEPHGVRFGPRAVLSIPLLDDPAAGPFDAYEVDPVTGQWQLLQSDVAVVGTGSFLLDVTRGTLVAVAPRSAPPAVKITGRVVSGTQPLAGWRASCWNRASPITSDDGKFEVDAVPDAYGVFLVRLHPAVPGASFAGAVSLEVETTATLGDVLVQARAPDAIRPTVVRSSPEAGATNVDRRAQVVVTFSEPIDSTLLAPFKLLGLNGEVTGRLNYDNPFTARFIPAQPLDPAERYTILVSTAVQDLAGNPIDDAGISRAFTTRGGAPDPAPTDTVAFGLAPLFARRGDPVSVLGRNFTGGSAVTFGSTNGLVTLETTDEVRALVPAFEPAGDVTLKVSAGGTTVNPLRPLVLDLRASVATVYSGDTPDVPLAFLDRARPPARIVVHGDNLGGTSITIDGVGIAAVDSLVRVGGIDVAQGRLITLPTPAPTTLVTGPVVVRGSNGRPGATYRFIQVRR